MTEIEKTLEQAGFTPNEARVYVALSQEGRCGAGQVMKMTGLSRQGTYDALEKLSQKGVVSQVVSNGIKTFIASPPSSILEFMKEREEAVKDAIGSLGKRRMGGTKEEVYFYHGKEGLKAIYYEMVETLEDEDEILVLGGSVYVKNILDLFIDKFHQKRARKGIKFRIIYNSESKGRGKEVSKLKLTKVRYLAPGYSQPMEFNCYGNRTTILFFSKEKPMGVVIENEQMADAFRSYFEFMWKLSEG